jgi:hypothetical protein
VFKLFWAVSVGTHINPNEFEATWKKVAFAKLQREIVGAAYHELASHIGQRMCKRTSPADDVIHNDVGIHVIVDAEALLLGKFFPYAVDVMDEVDEGCRPVGWSEWHYCVGPFDGIHPLERKFLLTIRGNSKLVVAHGRIEHPHPTPLTKLVEDCRVASRNWVCNHTSDTV